MVENSLTQKIRDSVEGQEPSWKNALSRKAVQILEERTQSQIVAQLETDLKQIDFEKLDQIKRKLEGAFKGNNDPAQLEHYFENTSEFLDRYQDVMPQLNEQEKMRVEAIVRYEAFKRLSQLATEMLPEVNVATEIKLLKEYGVSKIAKHVDYDKGNNPVEVAKGVFEKKGFKRFAGEFAGRVNIGDRYFGRDSRVFMLTEDNDQDLTANFLADVYYDYAQHLAQKTGNELAEKYSQIAREKDWNVASDQWRSDRDATHQSIKDHLSEMGYDESAINWAMRDILIPSITSTIYDRRG